jgi:hypothetical protein
MRIHVNPDYDLSKPPEDNDFQYVNPVALNNEIVTISNEMLTLAEAQAEAVRKKVKANLELSKAKRTLEQLEQVILSVNPLTATESKSLKTIATAIAVRAHEQGKVEELSAVQGQIAALEDIVTELEAVERVAQLYWKTGEALCESIKTHLAFVKADQRARY